MLGLSHGIQVIINSQTNRNCFYEIIGDSLMILTLPASPELRELAKKAGELCEKNNVELGKISVWHSINK